MFVGYWRNIKRKLRSKSKQIDTLVVCAKITKPLGKHRDPESTLLNKESFLFQKKARTFLLPTKCLARETNFVSKSKLE